MYINLRKTDSGVGTKLIIREFDNFLTTRFVSALYPQTWRRKEQRRNEEKNEQKSTFGRGILDELYHTRKGI